MKTSSSKRFTLIELLVVIAIIMILAGLVFPALGVVRNNAKKSKASSECQSLKTAIIMYESEFSCWPANVTGSTDTTVSDGEYVNMCKRLTGDNGKKMVFYEVGVGYRESDGILDPWGQKYKVILDVNFDGKIRQDIDAVAAVNRVKNNNKQEDIRTRVAVYSRGVPSTDKDSNNVNNLATRSKLVISW